MICQQENTVAVNSALQVDLFGQVAADTVGKLQYSGPGGQVDFVRGANMSKGGRNIIAMPSTAKHWWNRKSSSLKMLLASACQVLTERQR